MQHNNKHIVWWVVCFISIACSQVCAQTAPLAASPPLSFDHITSAQGLLNERVSAIAQDAQGFLWFGTWNGLYRYDGQGVKVYQHDPHNPRSLSENLIGALCVDRRGRLWIGTGSHGLSRFDAETEQFISYQPSADARPDITIISPIFAITEDRAGLLWIGTNDQGVYRFDPEREEFVNYRHDPDDPHSLGDNAGFAVYEDRAGVIWVGSRTALNRLDRAAGRWTRYLATPAEWRGASEIRILSIAEDARGALWLASYGNGLCRFMPETGELTRFVHDPANPASLSDNKVRVVSVDSAGMLWIGTWSGGLNLFDPADGRFRRYAYDPLDAASIGEGAIQAIYTDQAGSVWLGLDSSGLSVFHHAQTPVRHYVRNPANPASLSDTAVRAIYQDRQGAIWIGTATGGVNRLDPETGQFTVYRNDPADPHSLTGNSVYAIFEDREGALWVGTFGGLNRFDPETQGFTRYLNNPADPASISHNFVQIIAEDSQGNLWVGTEHGLNRLNRATQQFIRYLHDPGDAGSLSQDTILSLYVDCSQTLWVGTADGGLNRYDPQHDAWQHYRHNPDDPESVSHDRVYSIHEDRAGRFWVGTFEGLNLLDRATGRCVRYTQRNGLPSDVIAGILEDDRGNLWLSTFNGLARFDPRTAAVRKYDRADGLNNLAFDIFAYHRTRNGELWFGGKKGIDIINPKHLAENSYLPPVVLTGFEINNQPVPIGGDSVLQRAIAFTDALTLSYRDRVISFEFAALNFIAPEKNRYQYMLDGFDADWIERGSDRRRATYTNLDPGQYVFRVRGANNDGVWNPEEASIRIAITPLYWRTWWFYALCLLSVAGVFGLVYWNKVNQLGAERDLAAAIRDSEEKYRRLVEHINDLVCEIDVHGTFLFLSPQYEQVLGYAPRELLGRNASELIHPDHLQVSVPKLQETFESRTPSRDEWRFRHKNGEWRWLECVGETYEKSPGEIRLVVISRDITERKLAEEQAREYARRLEDAVQQKQREMEALFDKLLRQEKLATIGQMAGSMAHELRNPLGAIRNAIYYLNHLHSKHQLTGDHPKVRRYLELIDAELRTAERVIAYVLQMTRQKPVQRVQTSLRPIIEEALTRCHIPPDIAVVMQLESEEILVFVDAQQLRQVFENLLTNAAQAIDGAGRIDMSARALPENGGCEIVIRDTGCGIAPETIDKIFEPLYTTKATGTGLGLSICKQIIEQHQGRIGLTSIPGQGTTATIVLPDSHKDSPHIS